MDIQEIERAYWTDAEAPRAAATLVKAFLRTQPEGKPMGTTALVVALGGTNIGKVANHLTTARNLGLLAGYFVRDEKHKSFGKARVVWSNPGQATPEAVAAAPEVSAAPLASVVSENRKFVLENYKSAEDIAAAAKAAKLSEDEYCDRFVAIVR